MHIALCDDNVADRKQFERLVKRESDRRAADEGILFADSFGNSESLLTNPMQYDVFYVDMCKTPGVSGADVVNALTKKGVNAPIVMCCSDINYREMTFPVDVFFLDKPIKSDELSASLDRALEITKQAIPLIELRVEKETYYVTEPDILYAAGSGRKLHIHLKDGRILTLLDNAQNLFSQLEPFPTFFSPTKNVVLNGRYMEKIFLGSARMSDGKTFRISHRCMPYARKLLAQFGTSS